MAVTVEADFLVALAAAVVMVALTAAVMVAVVVMVVVRKKIQIDLKSFNKRIIRDLRYACALDVILITNNTKDFQRYPGLKFKNWINN
ncbi:MAG: hypothetical protein P8Y45_19535 [Exilibacterium sp.]